MMEKISVIKERYTGCHSFPSEFQAHQDIIFLISVLEGKDTEIAALKENIQKWIKIAGENQKSANVSAEWAEKAENRIKELEREHETDLRSQKIKYEAEFDGFNESLKMANNKISLLVIRIKELEEELYQWQGSRDGVLQTLSEADYRVRELEAVLQEIKEKI